MNLGKLVLARWVLEQLAINYVNADDVVKNNLIVVAIIIQFRLIMIWVLNKIRCIQCMTPSQNCVCNHNFKGIDLPIYILYEKAKTFNYRSLIRKYRFGNFTIGNIYRLCRITDCEYDWIQFCLFLLERMNNMLFAVDSVQWCIVIYYNHFHD